MTRDGLRPTADLLRRISLTEMLADLQQWTGASISFDVGCCLSGWRGRDPAVCPTRHYCVAKAWLHMRNRQTLRQYGQLHDWPQFRQHWLSIPV